MDSDDYYIASIAAIFLGVFYVLVFYMFSWFFCFGIMFLEYRDFGMWLYNFIFDWNTFFIIFVVMVIIFFFNQLNRA
ncbi:hypothetical protein [Bacillus mobilis]